MTAPSTLVRPHVSPGLRARLVELGVSESRVGVPVNAAARGGRGGSGLNLPTTQDELAEWISANGEELLRGGRAGGERLAAAIASYAKAARGDGELQAQIHDQIQAGIADFARENGMAGRLPMGGPSEPSRSVRSALNNPRAPGASVNGLFGDFGEYLHAIRPGNTGAPVDKLQQLQNAFSSTTPSDGGFLVPEQLRSQLLAVSLESSIVRPRATVIPMGTLRVPVPTIDATSNVSSVHGGVVGYWSEEGATLTPSQPSFARTVLEAKKPSIYSDVPNELWQDSAVSLPIIIDLILGGAISWYEDDAFLNGSGVGEPLGVLNSPAVVSVTRDTTSAILWADIANMYARMLPASLNRAVWLVSPAALTELATMTINVRNEADSENVGGSAALVTNGAADLPLSILGRPVLVTEKVPDLGSAQDISFCDLGYYLLGDRMTMTTRISEDYKFQSDETSVRVIERVDGRLWLQSAITPKNNGSTLSPVVSLAA